MGFGSNFQADETAAESPAAAPGWSNADSDFLIYLPSDLDGPTWTNLYQALRAGVNWTQWTKKSLKRLAQGLVSVAGLVVDGTGTATKTRSTTSALLRFEASDGTARSLVDYLGFRAGPVWEISDKFASFSSSVTTPQGAPGWTFISTTNTDLSYCGRTGGLAAANWVAGALRLNLNASRTNTDGITLASKPFFNLNNTASDISRKCVTVVEFSFAFRNTVAATGGDYYLGLSNSGSNQLATTTPRVGGIRWAPSFRSDTTLQFDSSDGTNESVVDTGIIPAPNVIYRCRIEAHGADTPLGQVSRLFVNGALVSKTSNLPWGGGVDGFFSAYLSSNATNTTQTGLELGNYRAFTMPYGALALAGDI